MEGLLHIPAINLSSNSMMMLTRAPALLHHLSLLLQFTDLSSGHLLNAGNFVKSSAGWSTFLPPSPLKTC
jgi:hypothetical protein